jgi:hypothetical protein
MQVGVALAYHFEGLLSGRVWWDIEQRVFGDDLWWTRPRWSCSMWQRSTQQSAPGRHRRPALGNPRASLHVQMLTRREDVHLRLLRSTSAITKIAVAMSTKAKATFAGTVLGTIGIVYFVHYQQVADKAVSQYLAIPRRASC